MDGRRSGRGSWKRALAEAPMIALVAFALVFGFVRPVVASPFYVGSESMVPTLEVWDRLLVNKLAYDLSPPDRGDIVLLEDPRGGPDPLVKRVVALSGDTVMVREGTLFVNGEPRSEPYVAPGAHRGQPPYGPARVPPGHVFVMGDNRDDSLDSRFFGPVPERAVVGEALFRFWPPSRLGTP